LLRRKDSQSFESQFARGQIANVPSDNRRRISRHRQLDQVIVGLIRQIGPPGEKDLGPTTNAQEAIQHRLAL
jgi:hypothetical protein